MLAGLAALSAADALRVLLPAPPTLSPFLIPDVLPILTLSSCQQLAEDRAVGLDKRFHGVWRRQNQRRGG